MAVSKTARRHYGRSSYDARILCSIATPRKRGLSSVSGVEFPTVPELAEVRLLHVVDVPLQLLEGQHSSSASWTIPANVAAVEELMLSTSRQSTRSRASVRCWRSAAVDVSPRAACALSEVATVTLLVCDDASLGAAQLLAEGCRLVGGEIQQEFARGE